MKHVSLPLKFDVDSTNKERKSHKKPVINSISLKLINGGS